MRRMIEAAEMRNQRTVAPEASSMHLTPDTDPASTFRLRRLNARPRLEDVQYTSSPPGSAQVSPPHHLLALQRTVDMLLCFFHCNAAPVGLATMVMSGCALQNTTSVQSRQGSRQLRGPLTRIVSGAPLSTAASENNV
jgi:hypothetical protein